jgi:hypothetical protein
MATRWRWPPDSSAGYRCSSAGELDQIKQLGHARRPRGLRCAALLHAECDVVGDRQVREQGIVLEHHAHFALVRRQVADITAVDQHVPGGRVDESGNNPERRRLAAAGGTQQRQELAIVHRQVERGERQHVAIAPLDPFQHDLRQRLRRRMRLTGRWYGSIAGHRLPRSPC